MKVTIEFNISIEGFESKEQAKEYYKQNSGELLEALDFTDNIIISLDDEELTIER